MLYWNIFEITSGATPLIGQKFRGKLRKFSIENDIVVIVENAEDKENCVRFALPLFVDERNHNEIHRRYVQNLTSLENLVKFIVRDSHVEQVLAKVPNPVLSKLTANDESRYTTQLR